MKRLASLVFGAAFASTGAWFLYRHLLYAGFFDPWFALLACLMVAAGLGLLWLARRCAGADVVASAPFVMEDGSATRKMKRCGC